MLQAEQRPETGLRRQGAQDMGTTNRTQGICALYGKTPQEVSDRNER
jgi:hypothetical protein